MLRPPLSDLTAPPLIRSPAERLQGSDTASLDLAWRVVGLANLYRLLLPPVLLRGLPVYPTHTDRGRQRPELFSWSASSTGCSAALYAFGGRGHWPSRRVLVLAHTLLDSAAVSALLYCSGGAASGLGILLVIPVGAMALLAEGRDAFANAAIAALGILVQQICLGRARQRPDYRLPAGRHAGRGGVPGRAAGLAGIRRGCARARRWCAARRWIWRTWRSCRSTSCSICARASWWSTRRLHPPDQRIGGADARRRRRRSRRAARRGLAAAAVSAVDLARQRPDRPAAATPRPCWPPTARRVIRPHFAPLGDTNPSPVIVFLEDTGVIAAKVQQTKLAALGRLSRQHRARDPQSRRRHEPRRAAAGGVAGTQ